MFERKNFGKIDLTTQKMPFIKAMSRQRHMKMANKWDSAADMLLELEYQRQ